MFNPRHFARFVFLFLVCGYLPAASADPNDVAREFFDLLQSEDYAEAALLFDPTELNDFRGLLSFVYENVDNPNDELINALFGAESTAESVATLTDAEFLASFLALTMGEMKKSMPLGFSDIDALGYVSEGSDIAHVVTRFNLDMSEGGVSMIEVVSMRKVDDNWRILMQADMKAMANQIRATYGNVN